MLARMRARATAARIANVVMMGMGEPFLNYDEVLAACRTINDPAGFGLGARHDRDLDGRLGARASSGWPPSRCR